MPAIRGPRIHETHVSYVFLVGDRAYKLKKPVTFDFIDLARREQREAICHREVELNRRLAPDVYLGVLDVLGADGPVDHLVEMRRLPDEARLATRVARGDDVAACLRSLARDLAAFHARAPTSGEISAAATRDAVRAQWDDNIAELRRFGGEVLEMQALERVALGVDGYLSGRAELFAARIEGGHVRDGHGDLLAEDIFCLDDGPRALDCIEFDDRLRWLDVVSDVACLAMDLERLGAPELAGRFLAWYREFSGETYPPTLADHYVAYRAGVRAKVACLKHEQGDGTAGDEARRHLELCDRHLELATVRLVLVGGLPGTGKSTLCSRLADRTGWAVIRSDEIRKELAGQRSAPGLHAYREGIYSPEQTERTYAEMLSRARALLAMGVPVILDASWASALHREAAARLAGRTATRLVQIRCVLDVAVAQERMADRAREGADPSDADAEIARAMSGDFDVWPDAAVADTTAAPEALADGVLHEIIGMAPRAVT